MIRRLDARRALVAELRRLVALDLPLVEELRLSENEAGEAAAARRVADRLDGGEALSAAVEPELGPEIATLLAASERAGSVPRTLELLEDVLERLDSDRRMVTAVVVGPLLTLLLAFVVGGWLLSGPIPQLATFSADGPSVLFRPLFLFDHPLLSVALLLIAGLAVAAAVWTIRGRLLPRIPIVGVLVEHSHQYLACRLLEQLVAAATPLHEALDLLVGAMPKGRLRDEFRRLAEEARSGAITASGGTVLRPVLTALAGGEPGRVARGLARLSEHHREEMERASRRVVFATRVGSLLVAGVVVAVVTVGTWDSWFLAIGRGRF